MVDKQRRLILQAAAAGSIVIPFPSIVQAKNIMPVRMPPCHFKGPLPWEFINVLDRNVYDYLDLMALSEPLLMPSNRTEVDIKRWYYRDNTRLFLEDPRDPSRHILFRLET